MAVLASMVWFEYLVLLCPNTKKDSRSSCYCLFLVYFYLYFYICIFFGGGGGGAAFENILKRFHFWSLVVYCTHWMDHGLC